MTKALIPLIVVHYNDNGEIIKEFHYTCLEEFLIEKGWEEYKDSIIDQLEEAGFSRFQNHLITHSTPH